MQAAWMKAEREATTGNGWALFAVGVGDGSGRDLVYGVTWEDVFGRLS